MKHERVIAGIAGKRVVAGAALDRVGIAVSDQRCGEDAAASAKVADGRGKTGSRGVGAVTR